MIEIIKWHTQTELEKKSCLQRPVINNTDLTQGVSDIITAVREGGDNALMFLTKQYDSPSIESIQVREDEFLQAKEQVNEENIVAAKIAIERVKYFQTQCLPQKLIVDRQMGIECRKMYTPIERVGLYVPGGQTPLISTLIMLAVPALIAGCQTRIVCTPPDPSGQVNPYLLEIARLCGIEKVYKLGGAQAIAAMAYGTTIVPKVDKIVGPGNSWVTEAKKQVSQTFEGASIDIPAGPSELMIIADSSASAEFIAADLLSQAEHGIDSHVICITDDLILANEIEACVQEQIKTLSRNAIITQSLKHAKILVVDDLNIAISLSNDYAPEHLSLQVKSAKNVLEKIVNAGAVFVGPWTPETMGDYITGSNHVLPTYGYAKSASGLSVGDFMKAISVQEVSPVGLRKFAPAAMKIASLEGLEAHRAAVQLRLNTLEEQAS